MKRFDDVVVSARSKSIDFVLPAVARGQHENRPGLALFPNLADEIETGNFGQAEIDDGQVYGIFEREVKPLAPVTCPLDAEALFGELPAERFPQDFVVFDDQQPHSTVALRNVSCIRGSS